MPLAPAWQKGQSGNPRGGAASPRQRLATQFHAEILRVFEKYTMGDDPDGTSIVEILATTNPEAFLKLVLKTIPKDTGTPAPSDQLKGLSNDELGLVIDYIRALKARGTGAPVIGGTTSEAGIDGPDVIHDVHAAEVSPGAAPSHDSGALDAPREQGLRSTADDGTTPPREERARLTAASSLVHRTPPR
jgi:hypothetical protein